MTEKLVTTWIALTLVTLITRIGPLFASNWLKRQPWMESVANKLPCMILVLLVLHQAESSTNLLAFSGGIAAALGMQAWKKQIIVSIIGGVIIYTIGSVFF
ncbi:MAG: AzlD domain-containing protein [Simkaniaceae bacterium]|nr:AzlD domain-containing protein [Simkaniaceae bacterium]